MAKSKKSKSSRRKKQRLSRRQRIVLIALLAVLVIGLIFYVRSRPPKDAGSKKVKVTFIHANNRKKVYTLYTDETNLESLLVNQGLIAYQSGPNGDYITSADGESVDFTNDSAFWAVFEGESLSDHSIESISVEDGDSFMIIYEKLP